MKRLTTWQAFGALALTATLVLSGCGDKKDEASGASGDTSSVGKDTGVELTKDNFFTEVTKAQAKAGSSHVVMTTGFGGQEIKAEGDTAVGATAADTKVSMKMELGSQGSMDLRVLKNVVYLNFGPVTDNKFAKIDLTDKSNPLVQQFGGILDSFDPSAQANAYKDAVTSVTKKGSGEKIDGVDTTAYVVVIDPSKVTGASGSAQLPKNFELTMYLGPDNLPRKVEGDLAAAGTTVKMSMLYSKWGEAVDIQAPPASQITDKNPFGGVSG